MPLCVKCWNSFVEKDGDICAECLTRQLFDDTQMPRQETKETSVSLSETLEPDHFFERTVGTDIDQGAVFSAQPQYVAGSESIRLNRNLHRGKVLTYPQRVPVSRGFISKLVRCLFSGEPLSSGHNIFAFDIGLERATGTMQSESRHIVLVTDSMTVPFNMHQIVEVKGKVASGIVYARSIYCVNNGGHVHAAAAISALVARLALLIFIGLLALSISMMPLNGSGPAINIDMESIVAYAVVGFVLLVFVLSNRRLRKLAPVLLILIALVYLIPSLLPFVLTIVIMCAAIYFMFRAW